MLEKNGSADCVLESNVGEDNLLETKLCGYANSDIYPFHMPGHKRQMDCPWNPYRIDITEIEGFDNLHHAREILKESQGKASELYGSKKAYYLVNGSTCGILAAICAATHKGDKILVARNCHKAVYHALLLQELVPIYIYPEITSQGIQGQIRKETIQKILENEPEIKAAVITSPTYDGVVSDVRGIAELLHTRGIPLIVDEAHGAHFGFSEELPENAIQLGADVVIVSVHKTLPAFTQTALLHLCSDRISESRVERYLDIFETSSPSYILMAGIERCVRMLSEEGKQMFVSYMKRLNDFYLKVEELKCLKIIKRQDFDEKDVFDFDKTKIIVFTEGATISGKQLHDLLLYKYKIQVEMVASNYVLALSSVMDREEGFDRLARALLEIDEMLETSSEGCRSQRDLSLVSSIYKVQTRVLEMHEVECSKKEAVELEKAIGRVVADYVYLYPPGIPIIVPGEQITEQLVEDIRMLQGTDLELEGLVNKELIKIVIS